MITYMITMTVKDCTHREAVSLLVTAVVICRLAVDDLRRCLNSCVVYIQHSSSEQLLMMLIT